ncbi:MAG TPA: hypothetical protein VFB29_14070 [Pseudolabrys sp.]|nr:hypothetical protein [Pseudolabrys sp.]
MVAVTYGVADVAAPKNAGHGRAAAPRTNIVTRFVTALMEARLRQAYREIRRHAHLLDHNDPAYKELLKS